ncbi:hypothetical protein ACH5RR_003823 [Cinchona calisaya]|uniref:DUF761 domain-containing protein n=1 Tax=Cinchona calisaya TaxID=153742 RepID=A0ABD3AWL4_9GENT
MSKENRSLLGRLKAAVRKIKFLLNFNVDTWKIASIIGRATSSQRRLSFNDRPGLRACLDNDSDPGSARSSSSSSSRRLERTISFPSGEEDIDKRAEMFIANFYKQLQLERQISLELRYARADSFDSSSP